MSTSTCMTEEEYLASGIEGNPEFVDGKVIGRGMPTYSHAAWQLAIASWFLQHAKEWGIRSATELHVKTARGWRIPDVSVLDRSYPIEQRVVEHLPVAVFEVLSPDDRVSDLYDKLRDYAAAGIPEIWVIDPGDGVFKQYRSDGSLVPASRFTFGLMDFPFEEITKLLDN